ncbi:hypothetical protein AKG43_10490 [Neisseria sp. 74A18]|nr:hypothetical protein AKG43_10490 [Neisseria sp. 74A18]
MRRIAVKIRKQPRQVGDVTYSARENQSCLHDNKSVVTAKGKINVNFCNVFKVMLMNIDGEIWISNSDLDMEMRVNSSKFIFIKNNNFKVKLLNVFYILNNSEQLN